MTRCGSAAILGALSLLACGPSDRGNSELSWAQCRDGIDNDLDGLADCADSDCRAIPCVDAGIPDAASTDAQTHDAADAAVETCDPACLAGEVCRDQQCVIPLPTPLRIEILSVDGPSASGDLLPFCFDTASGDCGLPPACTGCPPDPYVRIDIERPNPNGGVPVVTTVARTRAKQNAEFAMWTDDDRWMTPPGPVLLEPTDNLVLVAVDFDGPTDAPPDEYMFDCVTQAASLRMGPQRCVVTPSNPLQSTKSEFEIWFDVRPP